MGILRGGYRYGSLEEFVNEIEMGLDIEFLYNGKHYSLGPVNGGFEIAEAYRQETAQVFPTARDLVEKYMIGDKPLKDIVTEIELI